MACLPALLGTILIFMDQQITAVIVNRKENKLKASVPLPFFGSSLNGVDKMRILLDFRKGAAIIWTCSFWRS